MADTKSQATGGPGGTAALEARIERIRQTITAQQARLARGSMLTASVGAILCVLMAVYFYIGYSKIKEVATPKKIVEAAESMVMESLPSARKALEAQINESAKDWAKSVSAQAQENIPTAREKLEDFIMAKADEALDDLDSKIETQFRDFVSKNQSMLSGGFTALKRPDDAEQFVTDLHSAVEKQLSSDMRQQSQEVLHTAVDLNNKLGVLKLGKKLNREQALEREILMIAKRLQKDSQADLADKPKRKSKARFVEGESEEAATDKPADEPGKPKESKANGDDSKAKEPEAPAKDAPKKETKNENSSDND